MTRPNVLLVVADDMGYGDFGLFGNGLPRTPVLDNFLRESVCLTHHYSAAPVCTPARAALLTGRYPHRTGAIDMRELRGLSRLSLRERTIGDLFGEAGYVTGLVGKWHTGTVGRAYRPNARGFDEFIGFCGGRSDYYDWRLSYGDTFRDSDGTYLTDVLADEACAFIQRHAAEPFFLHVAFNAPHSPLQAPVDEVRPFAETGQLTTAVATIYAMNHRMDSGLETIFAELDHLGLAENTIVVFTSDNGPWFGGRGDECRDRYNAFLAGSKAHVYEGGIRVPAAVRWPAGIEGERILTEFVHGTDWLPTLLTAAGIDLPSDVQLDGHNVLPLLAGEPHRVNDRRFWQWNRYTPIEGCNAAMRDGPWKLVRPAIAEAMRPDPDDAKLDRAVERYPERYPDIRRDPEPHRELSEPGPPQLFHLVNDPSEQHNLADRYPARVARMSSDLEDWFNEVEAERKSITV